MSDKAAPGYSATIKSPMDLGAILDKVDRGVYTSLESFTRDIELVFSNCIQYNSLASPYTKVSLLYVYVHICERGGGYMASVFILCIFL